MKLIVIICCVLSVNNAFVQEDSIAVFNRLKQHIGILASDSLLGRSTGSKQEQQANDYVISQWIKSRKVKLQKWNYTIIQPSDTLDSEMIGCFINNKSKSTLLIGAHIDHIGLGGSLSKSIGKAEVHNGADDNAAGVAVLIELQRHYATQKLPFNILFVSYTGHEIGTFGSEYLSKNWPKKFGKLFCVLNFDMIGRLDTLTHKLYTSSTDQFDSLLVDFNSPIKSVIQDDTRLNQLDTKHFLNLTIPCATFTTGMHSDYHRVSDDAAYIHYPEVSLLVYYFENLITTKIRSFLP